MDDNCSGQVSPKIVGSTLDDVEASVNVEFGMKSDLFNGYTWPGWITMVMCFLGASTNMFHVST